MRALARSKKKATRTKAYRFDARLNERQKTLIQRAADLEGRTMTDFVLHSAERAAERAIEDHGILTLTAQDTRVFVEALLNPPDPGPVLRAGARHYKRTMSR